MKKYIGLIGLLFSLSWISCTQDNDSMGNFSENLPFSGNIMETVSRTTYGSEGEVIWSNEDAVSIFTHTLYSTPGYHRKYNVIEGGSKSAEFKLDGSVTPIEHSYNIDKHYAVYPYNVSNRLIDASTLEVDMSSWSTQNYVKGSFESGKSVMSAKSTDLALPFYNAHSILKIMLKADAPGSFIIYSVSLTSATKALNGKATLDMSAEKPQLVFASPATEANRTNTLTVGDVVLDSDYHSFFLIIPAGEYAANDLTFKVNGLNTISGTPLNYEITIPSAYHFERSVIKVLTKMFKEDTFSGDILMLEEDKEIILQIQI